MNDLISKMSTNDKMEIREIAEAFQDFIQREGLESKFQEQTSKGKDHQLTYEELERKCGLEPFVDWHLKRIRENQNVDPYLSVECQGMRQTGRTMQMIVNGLRAALSGKSVSFYFPTTRSAEYAAEKCKTLLKKAEIDFIDRGAGQINLPLRPREVYVRFAPVAFMEHGVLEKKFFDHSLHETT